MKSDGRERRRFKRANYPCRIYILSAPLHVIKCNTEDIGAGGVRVIIDEKIPVSTMVSLELYLSSNPIKSKGKIVWVLTTKDKNDETKFDTGVEFHKISEEDRKVIDVFVKSMV